MNRLSRLLFRLPLVFVSVLSLFSDPVSAENQRVTEPTDFFFTYEEPTTFYARTFVAEGIGSDPMLWLYDSNDVLVTANDDYHGLQSQIQVEVSAGTYRLRAGVCCGDPNRWYNGVQYDITYNGIATIVGSTSTTIPATTTTSSSTTSTTTTTSSTTTTTTTTTTTSTTTTVPETTTTVAETVPPVIITTLPENQSINNTTTSVFETTTTVLPTTTTTLPPTTTIAETTTTISTTTTTVPVDENQATVEEVVNALENAENMSEEELVQVIENLEVSTLSEEQESALIAVLNVATEEVKAVFESEVNVYEEGLDEYVPVGSTVTVGTRRVIIATTGLLLAMPTVATTSATTSGRRKE